MTETGVNCDCYSCSVVGWERTAVVAGMSEPRVLGACKEFEEWNEEVPPEARKAVDMYLLEAGTGCTPAVVGVQAVGRQAVVVGNVVVEVFVAVVASAGYHNHNSHTTQIALGVVVEQLAVAEEPTTGGYRPVQLPEDSALPRLPQQPNMQSNLVVPAVVEADQEVEEAVEGCTLQEGAERKDFYAWRSLAVKSRASSHKIIVR